MPIPTVLWAQRKDKLYVTLDIQDVQQGYTLKLENNADSKVGHLSFHGKAGKPEQDYDLELDLYTEIDTKESKVSVSGRNVFILIAKPDESQGHWPRLTKDPSKNLTHIKADWNKWVDEDEEDETPDQDLSQYNFSGLGGDDDAGFGGAGGFGAGGGSAGFAQMLANMKQSQQAGGAGDDEDEEDSDNELPDLVK